MTGPALLKSLTAVWVVGELELLGQECRESLLGMSQIEEGTGVNSGQLCWGSIDFIPLKTTTHTQTHFSWKAAPQLAVKTVTLHSSICL